MAAAHVDALSRAALGCKTYDQGFDLTCPAMRAWSDDHEDFIEGKADAALVGMLASPDEKIRYLAADKLKDHGKTYASDKGLAEAVVAAAEKEASRFAAYELGEVVGRIQVGPTGTFDRIKALVAGPALVDLRRGIVTGLLFNNRNDERVYVLVGSVVKDSDHALAETALNSLWLSSGKRMDITCQIYADHLHDPDDEIAAMASNFLSWQRRCSSRYDALLDGLEQRVGTAAGHDGGALSGLGSTSYLTAATHVCEDPKASEAQRKRAAEIGRRVAAGKDLSGSLRGSALETVLRCDPSDAGRTLVGTYRQDPEKYVADRARELLRKK